MALLDTPPAAPRRPSLPRPYLLWLAGTAASLLGDAVLYFALGWAAGGYGGGTAALVLTAVTVPRAVLLLPGGAVGDRFGARRVMIAGDAVMLAVTGALAVTGFGAGAPPWLLVLAAAVIGTVDAFYLPAAGAVPRLLVEPDALPRALAARQAAGQLAGLLGAPLGAALVAAGGPTGAAAADAGTFAVVLLVLLKVRPADPVPSGGRPVRGEGLWRSIAAGLRPVIGSPVLRHALALTAVAAGFLLPVVSLLNPLLARERGWGAGAAGLVAGGQGLGTVTVALLVTRYGSVRRAGTGAALGLCAAAAGLALVAAAPAVAGAVAGAAVAGAGSGLFACQIGPLVLNGVPTGHLARTQALLVLVQSLALVLANNALGAYADTAGAAAATLLCAAAVLAAGIGGLLSRPLRTARRSPGGGGQLSAD
ncbi:MFS transporter [Kitasatospora sp. NPDC088346]|uniref:MFS transporter n=1 Tax=Kitasatospora sp. NPDC088346 TaxID=3364073 RepID=UPI0038245A06